MNDKITWLDVAEFALSACLVALLINVILWL